MALTNTVDSPQGLTTDRFTAAMGLAAEAGAHGVVGPNQVAAFALAIADVGPNSTPLFDDLGQTPEHSVLTQLDALRPPQAIQVPAQEVTNTGTDGYWQHGLAQ